MWVTAYKGDAYWAVNLTKLRQAEFAYKVDTFAEFTLFKMTFYLKFLSPTVKVERDKYKIDNIKIYKKLTDRIKIILEKIS